MKKLISSICIAMSFTLLTSCFGTIDENNYLEKYSDYRTAFESASSYRTISNVSTSTKTSENEQSTNFTAEYIQVKNEDTFDAYTKLYNSADASAIVLDVYYQDGFLYGKSSTSEEKIKFEIPYDQFKVSYNSFNFLDIKEEVVKSKEIVKNEDDTTTVKLTLDSENYKSLFGGELDAIAETLQISTDYFTADFADVLYNITYDKKGNVTNIELVFESSVTVAMSKLLGDTIDGVNKLEDQVITRTITIDTSFDELNKATIEFPTDLDTYTAM